MTPLSVVSGQPGSSFRTAGLLNSAQYAPAGVMLSPDGRRVYVAVSAGLETFSAGRSTSWVHSLMWPAMLAGLALVIGGPLVMGRKSRRALEAAYPEGFQNRE